MAAEPPESSLGVPPIQGTWSPGSEPGSHFDNVTGNSSSRAGDAEPFFHVDDLLLLASVPVSLCGLPGNGAVVWLLGFRIKRTPFSVYILNLACADFSYLLCFGVMYSLQPLHRYIYKLYEFTGEVADASFLAGLGLLVAVSCERCVSALRPLWHRCRRPARLSSAVCALVWALALAWETGRLLYSLYGHQRHRLELIYEALVFATTLVLCASGLTLLVWVQRSRWRARPTRLYLSVLLSVLAFLLLQLPLSVCYIVFAASSHSPYSHLLLSTFYLLHLLNSVLNPIIYFFVGRHGQQPGRAPLRDVLQRALRDEEEGAEQRGTADAMETRVNP
ncbi:Mas-related G-protein coupled receptor member D [Galemys pyrenaicus]|uniref:Mas-related G-protein coupled receptor member D n=1 Tax=Galemys pyrenaicus TaxID=202257 RepID=A0A8J6AJL2_GALPY|nr:Mas-related G-protein coupled receptor member D [Galemys pyrenaicus]